MALATGEANAETLAQYILAQVATGASFGLTAQQFAEFRRGVEPELQPLVERWIVLYLGWLLFHAAAQRRGLSFQGEVMAAIGHAAPRDAAVEIERTFPALEAAQEKPQTLHGHPIPRTFWAAFEFALEDSASPYFHKPDTPIVKLDKLVNVLDRAATAAAPAMRALVGAETGLDERVYIAETNAAVKSFMGLHGKINTGICIVMFLGVNFVLGVSGMNQLVAAVLSAASAFGAASIHTYLVMPGMLPTTTCPYCRGTIPTGRNPKMFGRIERLKSCPICAHELPQ
jgi:hypothetical protein